MGRVLGNGCFVFLALLCNWSMVLFAAALLLSGAGCMFFIELECCIMQKHPSVKRTVNRLHSFSMILLFSVSWVDICVVPAWRLNIAQ